jgi:hypothetical protein
MTVGSRGAFFGDQVTTVKRAEVNSWLRRQVVTGRMERRPFSGALEIID